MPNKYNSLRDVSCLFVLPLYQSRAILHTNKSFYREFFSRSPEPDENLRRENVAGRVFLLKQSTFNELNMSTGINYRESIRYEVPQIFRLVLLEMKLSEKGGEN